MKAILIIFVGVMINQAFATQFCPRVELNNGNAKKHSRDNKIMKFMCNANYTLLGATRSRCDSESGLWDHPVPICKMSGCWNLTRSNGNVSTIDKWESASLTCDRDFELTGSKTTYCDGHEWDRLLGSCRRKTGVQTKSCDFENENLCGWTFNNPPSTPYKWTRSNGVENTIGLNMTHGLRSGPTVDSKKSKDGFFLIAKSSAETNLHKTRIESPMYTLPERNVCFQFYMFMHGKDERKMGSLTALLQPETGNLLQIWNINGNQENAWKHVNISLGKQPKPFQIIIKATAVESAVYSDIAIDEFNLDYCYSDTTEYPTTVEDSTNLMSTIPFDASSETTAMSDDAVSETMPTGTPDKTSNSFFTTTSSDNSTNTIPEDSITVPKTTGGPVGFTDSFSPKSSRTKSSSGSATTILVPEHSVTSDPTTIVAHKAIPVSSTPTTPIDIPTKNQLYEVHRSAVMANGTKFSGHPLRTENMCLCSCP